MIHQSHCCCGRHHTTRSPSSPTTRDAPLPTPISIVSTTNIPVTARRSMVTTRRSGSVDPEPAPRRRVDRSSAPPQSQEPPAPARTAPARRTRANQGQAVPVVNDDAGTRRARKGANQAPSMSRDREDSESEDERGGVSLQRLSAQMQQNRMSDFPHIRPSLLTRFMQSIL